MNRFNEELTALYPYLRSLAMKWCRNETDSEDLVQDTCLKALLHADKFSAGTNMRAWTSVIMRNTYLSKMRGTQKRKHDTFQLGDGDYTIDTQEQFYSLALKEAMTAILALPKDRQEALIRVTISGDVSAAQELGVPRGTIVSRSFRARNELREHRPD